MIFFRQTGYDSWEEGGDSDDSDPYPSNPYPQPNPYPTFSYPVYMPPSVLYPGLPVPVVLTSPDPRTYPVRNRQKKKVRYKNTPTYLDESRVRGEVKGQIQRSNMRNNTDI